MIRPSDQGHSQTVVNQAGASKRPTTALPEKLEKRLMGYAVAAGAAGVGVLALAQPAQADTIVAQHSLNSSADIIFTSVSLDLTLSFRTFYSHGYHPYHRFSGGAGGFTRYNMPIDLDHNGTPDLVFTGWRSFGLEGGQGNDYASGMLEVLGPAHGQVVGPGGPVNQKFLMGHYYSIYGRPSLGSVSGGFPNGNGFIGVQFQINGQTHFGWVGFDASTGPTFGADVHVWGYAYDTVPNQPILTGQGAPEPGSGSLVALALGSLGIGLWRRRKVATSEKG